MGTLVNPYIAGAPVTEARMFFGREDVFQWIENSIAGQYADHILVIHGQRRVGKTSVLKQLGNRLPKRFVPVFFDLQGRTHTTLDRFLWWLAREIVRVLKQDRGIEVPLPEKEAFSTDLEYFEHRFLPDLKPVLGNDTLLLTFDEFDNLEESEIKEELARPLIDYLRRLMGNGGLNFIFSIGSSGRKLENMQASYTEFFKTALYKKISFLDEDQTRNLITRPVESLIEYDKRAVTRIYQVAGGHPYFTQLTCHELFAECQRTDERHIHEPHVESVLEDVVERGTVNLKFVWDEATDIEKWTLAALAQLDKTDNRLLADFLRKQRVRFSETDLTSGLLHLREKDILTRENRFVIHLMKLWLQKNRPMEQAREELTEVNPIANRYIEIGLEFKDAGVYDRAIDSFKEALEVAKDNVQAQVNIGLTYMDQKSYSSAVVEFEKALVMDDEDVSARSGLCEAHLALGDAAMQRGRAKEAVQSYQRVLAINEEHTEARQRMAEIACQRAEKALSDGRDEEALSAFAEALKHTPEDPALIARVEGVRAQKKARVLAALLARSEKEAGAKNWEKASAALNEALAIAPADESILKKLESIAERQLEDRLEAILLKADQAEKSIRWDVAIAALQEYLALKADDTKIQARLAHLIEARHSAWLKAILTRAEQAVAYQKWDEAFQALNEVLSLEPENPEIRKKMDEVRAAQRTARLEAIFKQAEQATQAGKWDEAIGVLKEGIAFAPEEERLQARLAQVMEAKRAARLKAALRLAETAAASGKWNVAIDSLNEILSAEPDNVEIQKKLQEIRQRQRESQLISLRNQARAMARAERFDEALTAWQEYLKLEPEDREAAQAEVASVEKRQALAKSYAEAKNAYAKRNYDKAIGLLKGVVEQDYDYKDASHLLAESIELRRTARKWWQSRWLWGIVSSCVVLVVGWLAFRPGSPLLNAPAPSPTAAAPTSTTAPLVPTGTSTATVIPTITPTPLPLQWARLNSGQFAPPARIDGLGIDPSDPGVIYVSGQFTGMFRSLDGGISWQPVQFESIPGPDSPAFIDPSNSQVMYAGGGWGTGLYKTTDGGKSWQEFESDSEIFFDPRNGSHMYKYKLDLNKFYKSEDGGETWELRYELKEQKCPQENSTWAFKYPATDDDPLILANNLGATCGLYQSTDGGHTWKLIAAVDRVFNEDIGIGEDERGGLVLYSNLDSDGFVISYDNGNTWMNVDEPECSHTIVDERVPTRAYCVAWDHGGPQLMVTEDSGHTWKVLSPGQEFGEIGKIDIHYHGEDRYLYVSSDKGFFISTDGGGTWERRSNGLGAAIMQLTLDPVKSSVLYVDSQQMFSTPTCNLYRSDDGGRSWKFLRSRGWPSNCTPSFDSGNRVYTIDGPDLLRSDDRGETWGRVLGTSTEAAWIGVSPYSVKVFLVGDNNNPMTQQTTLDGGAHWQAGSGIQSPTWLGFEIRTFFEKTGKRIYAVAFQDVFYSEDDGLTWKTCGFPSGGVNFDEVFAIDPENPQRLFLATIGGEYWVDEHHGGKGGLFISNDACQSWQPTSLGEINSFVYTVALDPNAPDTVYAGTSDGAYISYDGGQSWSEINDGLLGATTVYSIVVDKDSNVYAATPYGIFKLEAK